MHKLLFVLIFGGVLVFSSAAFAADDNEVALCVGCTAAGQFQAAAKQAVGSSFTGERLVLSVNPDTGTSQWVLVTNTPPGQVPLSAGHTPFSFNSASPVPVGVAVPLNADPFSRIYVADRQSATTMGAPGRTTAQSWGVSAAEQGEINTVIQLTKKTFVVRLDPGKFPSYAGSQNEFIANANFAALQAAVPGWPPALLLGSVFGKLLKTLGLYTGHSFQVCDLFGNGDSACFEPNPIDRNILVQNGPAKDAEGRTLEDITNRVAGGGGGGMVIRDNPPGIQFGAPGSTGGAGETWEFCSYVGGKLISCYRVVIE